VIAIGAMPGFDKLSHRAKGAIGRRGNRFVLVLSYRPAQMCTTHLPGYFFHLKIVLSLNRQMELHACKLLKVFIPLCVACNHVRFIKGKSIAIFWNANSQNACTWKQ